MLSSWAPIMKKPLFSAAFSFPREAQRHASEVPLKVSARALSAVPATALPYAGFRIYRQPVRPHNDTIPSGTPPPRRKLAAALPSVPSRQRRGRATMSRRSCAPTFSSTPYTIPNGAGDAERPARERRCRRAYAIPPTHAIHRGSASLRRHAVSPRSQAPLRKAVPMPHP